MKKDRYGVAIHENEHAYELALQDMEQLIFSVTIFQAKDGRARIAMSGDIEQNEAEVMVNVVLRTLEGLGIIGVPGNKTKEDVS